MNTRTTPPSHPRAHKRRFIASLIAVAAFTTGPVQAQVAAVRANDFLNSMGINTHIHQNTDDATNVANALKYTGIRHIRDGGGNTSALVSVYNNTIVAGVRPGAKACLLPWNGNPAGTVTVALRVLNGNALLAMEGPNEANNWPVTYEGVTSSSSNALPVARFQKDMFAAIRADTRFNAIPIFAASDISGAQPNNCGLQWLTIPTGTTGTLLPAGTKFADYANCHNYVCGNGITEVIDNCAWKSFDPALRANWNGLSSNFGSTWRMNFPGYNNTQLATLPRVSTETGWYTAAYSGHNSPVTQAQQGKVLLNLYLAAFKRNWAYTFVYQMRDQGSESFGIYTTSWARKTAADYLRNFTTILQDTGAITPGSLNYTIPNCPATTHDLLIQKSNGTYYLAVWSELKTGSSNITVNLGSTVSTVKVFDPTIGSAAIQTLSNVSSVPLTVSDHPVILEIPSPTIIRLEAYGPPNGSSGDPHVMDTDGNASGGSIANYHANAIGDYVTYALPTNLAPGNYSVRVFFKQGPQRPKFQVSICLSGSGVWTNVGSEIDGYASAFAYTKFTVGNYNAASAAIYKIRLTATGRNPLATGATWNMLTDYIELVKL